MLFTNKKGSELSMNVIIIAAIALLILVILILFVFKSGDDLNKGTSCEGPAFNGQCVAQGTSCGDLAGTYIGATSGGCDRGMKCCVPIGNQNN